MSWVQQLVGLKYLIKNILVSAACPDRKYWRYL